MLLLTSAGCVSRPPEIKKSRIQSLRPVLQTAVDTAVKHSLEMRVQEALQLIAREHVEKSRLLELPGMIYDLPRRQPGLTIENDYRLSSLEHAVESCRILTTPAKEDLHKVQAETEKRKIALEQAVRWSKLDCLNNLKKTAVSTADLKNSERDIILELEISSGIPKSMIANFDFSSLPQPAEIIPKKYPEYVRQILEKYNSAPDSALRFADIVYRLAPELLNRSDSNFAAAFQLVQTCGAAIKQDMILDYARTALADFKKAEKALKNARIKSPKLSMELERARLMWRIAYFRNKYNDTVDPAEPDKKEMTFLKDLISLQGK